MASLFSYSLAYAEEIIPEETEVIEEVLETLETITPENPEQEILEDENLEEEVSEEDFVPELMQLLNSDLPSDEQGGSENFDTPACASGDVYVQITIPDSLVAVLGTGEVVQNGEWFLVLENGAGFSESESDITVPYDIAIVRTGTTLFVNIAPGIANGEIIAQEIADSINLVGGNVIFSAVFSGNVAVIDFQAEDCEDEEDFCTEANLPSITSILTETVTIGENTSLTIDEIFDLFGIVVEDLDGEGTVTISSNLSEVSYLNEGTYTITVILTDDEGCMISKTLTLVVEGDDDGDDDNGGGGSSGGKKKNKPQGEVLGATTCTPYLRTFMQMGEPNLKEDVEKLQIFLNNYMKENLVVDGVYGPETFEAVKRFQMQEFDEILKPWYITEPTGIVRETTTRHINNIMCPELNIQMPILYCATTGNLIYPDGTVLDPEPEYILYNGKPVIKKKVIIPEALLRTLEK